MTRPTIYIFQLLSMPNIVIADDWNGKEVIGLGMGMGWEWERFHRNWNHSRHSDTSLRDGPSKVYLWFKWLGHRHGTKMTRIFCQPSANLKGIKGHQTSNSQGPREPMIGLRFD